MPPVEHKLSKSTVAKARVGLNESALTEIFKFFFSSTAFIKVLTVTYNDDKYLTNRDGLMPTLAFDGQEMKATYRDNDPNRKHKGAVITTVINCNDRTVAIYKIAQKKNQESGCFLLALKRKAYRHHKLCSDVRRSQLKMQCNNGNSRGRRIFPDAIKEQPRQQGA